MLTEMNNERFATLSLMTKMLQKIALPVPTTTEKTSLSKRTM